MAASRLAIFRPMTQKLTVGVIGSGNWGSAIAKVLAENTAQHGDIFNRQVNMWVHDEKVDYNKQQMSLIDVINRYNENVKYLRGVKLPLNVVAEGDVTVVSRNADILLFVIPDQFFRATCAKMVGYVKPTSIGVSCVKGIEIEDSEVHTYDKIVTKILGIQCGVLSGANIANEVARNFFSETTIGWNELETDSAILKKLFARPYFYVDVVQDVDAVSIGGALKNVIALGAGLIDGLGWGSNAQSALIRHGIIELIRFCNEFFPNSQRNDAEIILESCVIADVFTSCISGRNFKCASAFAKSNDKSIQDVQKELLNGQIAQGVPTASGLYNFLSSKDALGRYPMLTFIYKAINRMVPIKDVVEAMRSS